MPSTERPLVSVVVPVYNDRDGLGATLASLVEQTYPESSYEVIVVDNGSTDRTPQLARAVAAGNEVVCVEEETEIQGSYAARNAGIRASEGEILAFLDADVTVEPDWLETAVAWMNDHDAKYVGCRIEIPEPDREPVEPAQGLVGSAQGLAGPAQGLVGSVRDLVGRYDALTGFPVERYVRENEFAPTCGLLVAREVFDDVGLFDPGLVSGGDTEFGQRVADAGYELHYAPELRVEHPARSSLRSLLGKHVRVGRGMAQRSRRHPDRYDPPSPWSPRGLLGPHPRRFHRAFGEAWTDLSRPEKVGMYAVGTLVGYAVTAGRALEHVGGRGGSAPVTEWVEAEADAGRVKAEADVGRDGAEADVGRGEVEAKS